MIALLLDMATEVLTATVCDEASYTISTIRTNDAQSRVEETPSEPIELPKAHGIFDVNENVLGGVQSCLNPRSIGWSHADC